MKTAGVIILCLFTSCLVNKAACQPGYPKPFKTLTVADGLPQSFVSGLIQDSTGFIWIATRDGLARYDGRKFKVFRHIPGDTSTLADNIISGLYMDKQQHLWIFFEAGDIDIFNTGTESLFHLTKEPVYALLFASVRSSQSVAEDNKGNIWLLGLNGGIFICNPSTHTLHYYAVSMLGLPGKKIAAIKTYNGLVALVTNNAIDFFDQDRKLVRSAVYNFPDPYIENLKFSWKITAFFFRKNGEMIILDERRVIVYKPLTGRFIILPLNKQDEPLNFSIAEDDNGQVFFDYEYTVYVLSPDNKLSVWKPKKENPAYGFRSMLVDRSGVLWMGGNGSGIQLYDLRLPRLSGISYKKNFHEDVLHNFLNIPEYEIKNSTLYDMQPYYLRWAKDKNHNIWLAKAGVQVIDKAEVYHYANNHLVTPPWHYTDTIKSHHVKINSIAFSPLGKLWGIDFNLRPVYFDTLAWSVTVYPPIDSVNINYTFTASSLLMDGEDQFWVSTALNGLFHFNRLTNKTIHYTAAESSGSLPTNQLMNIIQDAGDKNIFWMGSLGGGLIKFNKRDGRCIVYTTRQGLPNNTIYAIIMDAKGILWCSSNKGIFSFNPATIAIRNYTSKDGLSGDEFNRYHFLELPEGRISFGGVDGYTVFDPLSLAADDFQPPIALTSIRINNLTANFGDECSPFKQAVNSLKQIELPYGKNFLSFEFAALEYNISDKLQYRYMLEGLDKNWVYAGNDNVAAYTKIPAGDYTLKINATNTAGEWSSFIKTLPIIIAPPFWKTWWFITLMSLVTVAFAYFFIHSRISYIRKQEREKAKLEQEASELKVQALRAQMNPHFIFNCLNSIKALIQEDKKREAVIYLTTFSKLIRTQLNNAEQEVSLREELETCRLYTQLEALRFAGKIECIFEVDENIDTRSFKVPPLILQPFIENAIWHGVLPKKSGKVSVTVKHENNTISCVIDDDGIGRDIARRNKSQASSTYESKGMSLVRHRLGLYNTVNPNQGTVEVIDKKDAAGNSAGTAVVIKFKQEI